MDQTVDNITSNVDLINSQTQDPRFKFLISRLVHHLHDFARETQLTTDEWMNAIQFLTQTGKMCSETRQEFILLSDILGLSLLVDAINHPKPPNATENTVLGPFFTHDAHDIPLGDSIASEDAGETMLVRGRVTNTRGEAVQGARIEVWETDESGTYDTQYPDREHPDCRGRITTDSKGNFYFLAVKPVSYPIPNDGPVGKLLGRMQRHEYRPAHVHFMILHDKHVSLTTALYTKGDPYIASDAVFGVKQSLITDIKKSSDADIAKKYSIKDKEFWLLDHDFVLVLKEDEPKKVLPTELKK